MSELKVGVGSEGAVADAAAPPAEADTETPWVHAHGKLYRIIRRPEVAVAIVAAAEFTYFSFASPYFLTTEIWGAILVIAAELGIIACVGTMLLIAGDFDLSVGSVLGLAAAMIPIFLRHQFGILGMILAVLGVCAAIGLLNAFLVVRLRLPSLIVTIGGLMFYRGLALDLTQGENVSISPSETRRLGFFNSTYHSIYVSAIWFVCIAIVAFVLLAHTTFGNWIFATGGNRLSALSAGIRTHRVRTVLFMLSSLAAGFSGLLYTSRLTSIDGLSGTNLELEVVLAIVVGGTALHGGSGGIIGTVIGVFVLAMAKMGLVLVNVPAYWYQAGIGLFLVLTVAMNEVVRTRLFGQAGAG